MFKNKHIIIALIVAPILALVSYFAVDRAVSEKPHIAKDNTSYPLATNSNCRFASGECTLENGDVSVSITMGGSDRSPYSLLLRSTVALTGVKIFVGHMATEDSPVMLTKIDDQGLVWELVLASTPNENDQLKVVVLKDQTMFYAQTSMVFSTVPHIKPQR